MLEGKDLVCELTHQNEKSTIYKVTTFTSNIEKAGTSADIFIQIYGENLHTNRKFLCANCDERQGRFQRGKEDSFIFCLTDVEIIKKIRIGHDNSGRSPCWLLDKITICQINAFAEKKTTTNYEFHINKWFSSIIKGKSIEREFVPDVIYKEITEDNGEVYIEKVEIGTKPLLKKYVINVFTKTRKNIEKINDESIHVTLFGTEGDSGERKLMKNENLIWDAVDLGNLTKLKIRHEANSSKALIWFLDKVEVTDNCLDKTYTFYCGNWLLKDKVKERFKTVIYSNDACIPYKVNIVAEKMDQLLLSQCVNIYGTDVKCTGKVVFDLNNNKNKMCYYTYAADVGDVVKVEFCNNYVRGDSNLAIKEIQVEQPSKGKLFHFPREESEKEKKGYQTFESISDDPDTIKTFPDTKHLYEITIFTGDEKDAETNGSVYLQLHGKNEIQSNEFVKIPNYYGGKFNRFQRNNEDFYRFVSADVGEIISMKIHIDESSQPWYLEKIILCNRSTNEWYIFDAEQWLGKKENDTKIWSINIPACLCDSISDIYNVDYEINVKTSEISSPSMNSNVFLRLFGEFGNSGELRLIRTDDDSEPFEKNKTDIFTFKNFKNLGLLKVCRVWHDNEDLSSSWHLEFIEVKDLKNGKEWKFPCGKWLSCDEDDKQIWRDLILDNDIKLLKYKISVKSEKSNNSKENYLLPVKIPGIEVTDDLSNCSASANSDSPSNVYITLYGDNGDTGKRLLNEDNCDMIVECFDLGTIKSIKVQYDCHDKKSKWFLDFVEVEEMESNKKWKFECKQSLSPTEHHQLKRKATEF